ncbi:hypothetical protein EMGBS15_07390 [Filimonas sp.]|nr:hypothetical protein EMGBS15_07390 [Filimonas sp.]
MNKVSLLAALIFVSMLSIVPLLKAKDAKPDTVRTVIYVTSIHDIDFKQNEYIVNLWLWMKYKNKDFEQNLEIPQAKTYTKSY